MGSSAISCKPLATSPPPLSQGEGRNPARQDSWAAPPGCEAAVGPAAAGGGPEPGTGGAQASLPTRTSMERSCQRWPLIYKSPAPHAGLGAWWDHPQVLLGAANSRPARSPSTERRSCRRHRSVSTAGQTRSCRSCEPLATPASASPRSQPACVHSPSLPPPVLPIAVGSDV